MPAPAPLRSTSADRALSRPATLPHRSRHRAAPARCARGAHKTLDNSVTTVGCQKMSTKTKENARVLVLASGSRYRRELLERLAMPFEVSAANIDETPRPNESPGAAALRLAEAK